MNNFNLLSRSKMLLLTLVAMLGVSNTAWAQDPVSEGFEDWGASTVADGWLLINNATYGNSYLYDYVVGSDDFTPNTGSKCLANSSHSAAQGTTTSPMIVTPAMTGTLTFQFRKYNSSSSTKGYINIFEYNEETSQATGSSVWTCRPSGVYEATSKYQTGTITVGDTPKRYAIYLAKVSIDDFTYTPVTTAAEGPALIVKDGTKVTSPYAYNFGLAIAGATKVFTLSNPGTEAVEGLSIAKEGDFGAALSATTIAAGEEATLTVTMPATSGSGVITLSSTTTGIEDFVFNVSGTIKDPNKMFIDFSNGIPAGWTNNSSSSWTFATEGSGTENNKGYASENGSAWSKRELITSDITFAVEESLFLMVSALSGGGNYSGLEIKYQDGTEWKTAKSIKWADLSTTSWTQVEVTGIPAGTQKLQFFGSKVKITDIYGGELPMTPTMSFSASDYAFRMITTATTTEPYTILNIGRAEMTGLSVTSNNDNFVVTVTDNVTSISANSSATFTVTMKADVKGAHNGIITVAADGCEDVTFNVSGYVADTEAATITFDNNALPTGWENVGWTFEKGLAIGNYVSTTATHNSEMCTPVMIVGEGETMAIEAKGNSSFAEFRVHSSADNGATWKEIKNFDEVMRTNSTSYTVVVIDNMTAGNYRLKFEGYNVSINTINGFQYNEVAPKLTLSPVEDAVFGKVKSVPEAKTYTVFNSGTGKMTVNITSSNSDFSVMPATLENIESGGSRTFTVSFNYNPENLGDKEATITVTPTYNETEAIAFTATATAKDPDLWEEDFENGIPDNWTNIDNGFRTNRYNHDGEAYSGMDDGVLITPRLEATEGQTLTFDAIIPFTGDILTVEWAATIDAESWNLIGEYTSETAGKKTFTAPTNGFYYIRFSGKYVGIDNIVGFKLASGSTTGISNVKPEAKADNRYFDLNGRQVAHPTKGLYIVNGRTVVVK